MNQNRQYDPEMPCNKKGCSASVKESCCGCPEQLEYERQKKTRQMLKEVTSFWDEAIQYMRKNPGLYKSNDPEMPCNKNGCGLSKMFCDGCEEQMEYQKQHPEMQKLNMDEINARNKATAEAYGEDIIAECLIEECSELIQAVSKYRRACGNGKPTKVSVQKARENLAEEIADVEASIYMYRYLLNITDEELNRWYEMKSVPQHQA